MNDDEMITDRLLHFIVSFCAFDHSYLNFTMATYLNQSVYSVERCLVHEVYLIITHYLFTCFFFNRK